MLPVGDLDGVERLVDVVDVEDGVDAGVGERLFFDAPLLFLGVVNPSVDETADEAAIVRAIFLIFGIV